MDGWFKYNGLYKLDCRVYSWGHYRAMDAGSGEMGTGLCFSGNVCRTACSDACEHSKRKINALHKTDWHYDYQHVRDALLYAGAFSGSVINNGRCNDWGGIGKMTTSVAMVLLILGCALVTWIPRILPFILVKNMKMPKMVLRWLAYIPVCILSALVIEGFFEKEEAIVTVQWLNIMAFIPTLFVALLTKSLSK